MHIVKEADESRIIKATQMAGEQSEKLADTIKYILAFKGKDRLSVEIIEDAIDIVDGKKKPTDLIPFQPMRKATSIRHEHRQLHDIATWFVPDEEPKGTLYIFAEESGKAWISHIGTSLSKKLTSYICAKEQVSEERRAQKFAWDYSFKEGITHTNFKHDRLSERRMSFVRNR